MIQWSVEVGVGECVLRMGVQGVGDVRFVGVGVRVWRG